MNNIGLECSATLLSRHLRVRQRRGAQAGLMIALASALAALTAGCAKPTAPAASSTPPTAASAVSAPHATSPAGTIHFPATLFGFRQDTSAQARKLDQETGQMLAMMGMFAHPDVALYGSMDTGKMFILGVTELTATAKKYGQQISAASLRTGFLVEGSKDVQSFPAGTPGAVLSCGHVTRAAITEILCLRYSNATIGIAVYFNGSASGLGDAAAKTSRAIVAIGG